MNKNSVKIKDGLKALIHKPNEIMSGTIVAGSVDESSGIFSVMPTAGGKAIDCVLLSSASGTAAGVVLVPADNSNVIIGSVDGTGELTLLKTSVLKKATVTIGNVVYTMDETQVCLQNGSVLLTVGTDTFKMNTASESLFALIRDLITYISELTVTTSTGSSSVPINIADFSNLLLRLNNLLAA